MQQSDWNDIKQEIRFTYTCSVASPETDRRRFIAHSERKFYSSKAMPVTSAIMQSLTVLSTATTRSGTHILKRSSGLFEAGMPRTVPFRTYSYGSLTSSTTTLGFDSSCPRVRFRLWCYASCSASEKRCGARQIYIFCTFICTYLGGQLRP